MQATTAGDALHEHPRVALPALGAVDEERLTAALALFEARGIQVLASAAQDPLAHGARRRPIPTGGLRNVIHGRTQQSGQETFLEGLTALPALRKHPFIGRRASRARHEQGLGAILASLPINRIEVIAVGAQNTSAGLGSFRSPDRWRLEVCVTHRQAGTRSPSWRPASGRNCPTPRSTPGVCAPGSCNRTSTGSPPAGRQR